MLERGKYEPPETLFYIEFDLGKRKAKVNIREGETAEEIARQMRKIYSLSGREEK